MIDNSATIPGYARGFNCLLRIGGYGRRACRVLELTYGIDILTGSDTNDEAANRRVFYPLNTVTADFGLLVVHYSSGERDAFNAWVRGYWEKIVSGADITGYMKIDVPTRNFARKAIPQSNLTYGEEAAQANPFTGRGVFTTRLDFKGATDPLEPGDPGISFFTASKDKTAAAFYPAALQISGAESLANTIFDTAPAETSNDQTHQDYLDGRAAGAIAGNVSYDNYRNLVTG